MQNQKVVDVRTSVSEKSNEAKTDYPSATAGLQPNKFPIQTFKGSDKAWSDNGLFQVLEGETNKW